MTISNSDLIEALNKPATEQFITTTSELLVERVKAWFKFKGVYQDLQGILRTSKDQIITYARLRRQYMLDNAMFRDAKKGITESMLKEAFDEAIDQLYDDAVSLLKEGLKFDARCEAAGYVELEKWMSGTAGTYSKTDIAILKHFIWQVKRKFFGLPVAHHIMPIFTGAQGTGKSTAILKLIEPIKSLCLNGQPVSFVTDERHYSTLGKHYVVFFDEMSKAENTDIDRLKQIITATALDYRPLHTNVTTKVAQNCTFLGAANKDIRDLIRDVTGMRRFYQIAVNGQLILKKDLKDFHSLINSCDSILIWRAIDENRSETYLEDVIEDVRERQQEIRPLSSIEEFLIESELRPGHHAKAFTELYLQYKEFCSSVGRRDVVMAATFGRELTNRGFERVRRNQGRMVLVDASGRLMLPQEQEVNPLLKGKTLNVDN